MSGRLFDYDPSWRGVMWLVATLLFIILHTRACER